MHRRRRRQSPQDEDKGTQRYDCAEQADADTQRLIDEQLDVVGETLIRVIGRITLKLHSVMVRVVQPLAEIFGGHPAAPADLKPLIEIELVDRKHDKDGCQDRKDYDFPNKTVPVLLLQGVVETIAPLVHQHIVSNQRQLDGDHRGKQAAASPLVFGTEIWRGNPPYGGERRADVVHRLSSPGNGLQRPEKIEELELSRLKL